MAAILSGLFGGSKPSASAVPASDSDDFADFAGAPDPSPASFSAIPSAPTFTGVGATATGVPYTKWYNVHERHSLSEFKQEGYIMLAILVVVLVHLVGSRMNRNKAKAWITAHAPLLDKEFAAVGYGEPGQLLKEKSLDSFSTYATGRQNVAFADISIRLVKRYNPLSVFGEYLLSLFIESLPAPAERMEAILYPFDGKEALTVPGQATTGQELRSHDSRSAFDGFVWAVVNKDCMKVLRDERFDLSITTTKDNSKLPIWATVMSESSEITDLLLTPELITAVEEAGELMDFLIITDQPIDKPTKLEETVSKKRVTLKTRLASSSTQYQKTLPLFEYFLRLPDLLAQSAHFRPEVLRKIKATRDDTTRKLQKADEDEKAEERAIEREKAKKMKRDLELKGLDAKAQKKYLEKERDREQKKAMKKQTVKG